MNAKQNRLFDLVNDNKHEMEDLISTMNDGEVERLVDVVDEWIERMRTEKINDKSGTVEEAINNVKKSLKGFNIGEINYIIDRAKSKVYGGK